MAVTPQVDLPITFADRNPSVPGSGTPFDAAHMQPNFDALKTAHNSHTHDELTPLASIVISAYNSRRDKGANIKADGSHDEAALAEAFAMCTGPTVITLLDGDFDFGGVLATGILPTGIRVSGLGKGITRISGNPGAGVPWIDMSQTAGHTLQRFKIDNLTFDATGASDVGINGQSVTLGILRDIGAGNIERFDLNDVEFLLGSQWSLTPLCMNSNTGLNRWMRVFRCSIFGSGQAMYGLQFRKPTQNLWAVKNYIEFNNNGHGYDAYNPIAVYAGTDGFHVLANTIRLYQGHSPIACTPAKNGEVLGNVVFVTVPSAGEAGIEVQFKSGHGADADTPHDIIIGGNIVEGAYYGVLVNNNNDGTNPGQRPYNVLVAPNQISGSASGVDVYLQHGASNVRASAGNGVVQQDNTCVGVLSPGSALGGPVAVLGGGVNEVQQLVVANATGGTLALTDHGLPSAPIAYNAAASAVQAALRALTGVGTGLVCGGGPLGTAPVSITFQGQLGNRDVPQISADATGLVGAGKSATVTTLTPGSPVVPPANEIIIGGQHLFIGPLGSILLSNAAGTSVQRGLMRDENNVIRLGHGGGRDMIAGDTSGRIGIGDAFVVPSSVDSSAIYPAIVVKVPNSATRLIVAAGALQTTAGVGATPVDLASFLDSANVKLSSVRYDGMIVGSAGVATKYLAGAGKTTVVDGDFTATPPDGTLALHRDTTAGKTYISGRSNGVWTVLAGPL